MIVYEKPPCPRCREGEHTRHVHIAYGRVPGEEDRWSDIWACSVHGIDIKEVEGHLK